MLPLWLHLLALTIPAPVLAQPPVAVVPLPAVLNDREHEPDKPPVAVMVDSVLVRVTPGDESRVELELALRALEPGWVDLAVTGGALAVSSARLDGREVALSSHDGGQRWLTTELRGAHRLVVTGTVATPAASLDLPLPMASRARVELTEPGWDLEVTDGVPMADGAVLLAASSRLAMRWKPHATPAPKPRVITVESATAVSFDESGLEGHATLRYRVTHGSVEQVSFDLAGRPDSVQVSGPAVLEHAVRGQRVDVRLARPMEGSFQLQVAFRSPPPGDDQAHPAPLVSPQGVFEHTGWLTIARADTAMLVPEPKSGLAPVPGSSLPDWATGLVPGTPVVSYELSGRSQALSYRLLSYDPVAAPPTVVDEARYQLAATEHGRVLMKARYTVRNDRNQYLRLQPPAGFEVLGVRVAGQVRQPVADGDSIYIPLEKSVESLQGLISFPVDVYLLGDEAPWERKGNRSLRTPAVDAPVAYARWEVFLPIDVEWDEVSGLPRQVQDWTSSENSLEYGRAVESPDVADLGGWDEEEEEEGESTFRQAQSPRRGLRGRNKEEAQPATPSVSSAYRDEANEDASIEYFNQAYQAYNANDFDQAQRYLEQSLQLDPGNASAHALLGNVGVVMGKDAEQGQGDETQARRVRELARARAVDDELEQKQVQRKAEEALRAGDLEVAERELERLEEMTRDLSRLEQSESVEQRLLLEETAKQLTDTRGKLAKKKSKTTSSSSGDAFESNDLQAVPDRFVTLVLEEPDEAMPSASDEPWPDMAVAAATPTPPPVEVGGEGRRDEVRALQERVASSKATLEVLDELVMSGVDPNVDFGDVAGSDWVAVDLGEDQDGWGEPVGAAEPEPEDDHGVYGAYQYNYGATALEVAMEAPDDDETDADEHEFYDGAQSVADLDVMDQARPASRASRSRRGGLRRAAQALVPAKPEQSVEEDGRPVVYRQQTEIDFEDVQVEGQLAKPQGQLLLDRQQAQYDPMIQLRTDFDGEIADSTSDLTGGGLKGLDDAASSWEGAGPSEPIVMDFGVQAASAPSPAQMELAPRIVTLDGALNDMGASLVRVADLANGARAAGDLDRLQIVLERASVIEALYEMSTQAAASLLLAESQGDFERADHEKRKLLVADSKVRQLEAEAQAAVAGTYAVSAGMVSLEVESRPGLAGLLGSKGEQRGSGGLGSRGSGLGGGGTGEGLGGLGTQGRGSGASGYGTGGAHFGARADTPPPPPPPEPSPEPEYEPAPPARPSPVVAFGPPADAAPSAAPAAPRPSTDRRDPAMEQAHGDVVRGPVTTARTQETVHEAPPPGGTTVLPAPSQTVSAAHLVLNIPKAGERLAFEQLLVAENEPLTIDISYRTRSRR